jgi:hypothetical protein
VKVEDQKLQIQEQGLYQEMKAEDAKHQPHYRGVIVEKVQQKLLHHLSKGL